jgi:hypothetical protein
MMERVPIREKKEQLSLKRGGGLVQQQLTPDSPKMIGPFTFS